MENEKNTKIMEAIKQRHSVRQYEDRPIDAAVLAELQAEIDACNREGGLHLQLITNEPKAFAGFRAHYGKFCGVTNYIALVGQKSDRLEELCGYYGERVAIKAQTLGLNTCWVAMTYKKIPNAFRVEPGEKLTVVISLGYGQNRGGDHKVKAPEQVSNVSADSPDWFRAGIEAALLAPTAMNQQKFRLTREGDTVTAKAGVGFYTKIDLGIVKYHFEVGADHDSLHWA